MFKKCKLFSYKLKKDSDFIEIGGGEGDLSKNLIRLGYRVILFIEPDQNKFDEANMKLKSVRCLNIGIEKINFKKISSKSSEVTIIMQDVIEHIPKIKQKEFFHEIKKKYKKVYLIGRTPNLKSPFGMRNSFGDNTHLHRFTDNSLKSFLNDLGFRENFISCEPYKITGITSAIRYLPYWSCIGLTSLLFIFVFGKWEGFLTPNLVFYSIMV